MKYYVTIYIDKLLEIEIINSLFQRKGLDFTHAFLGLTRKHPDELDKQDEALKQERLKNVDRKDFDKKWYEKYFHFAFFIAKNSAKWASKMFDFLEIDTKFDTKAMLKTKATKQRDSIKSTI